MTIINTYFKYNKIIIVVKEIFIKIKFFIFTYGIWGKNIFKINYKFNKFKLEKKYYQKISLYNGNFWKNSIIDLSQPIYMIIEFCLKINNI